MNDLRPEYEAARLLASQHRLGSGVWVKELTLEDRVLFDTFENYRRICHAGDAVPCEGCTVKVDGLTLVLYNHGWDVARINYTLAHELGHIILHHGEDADDSEANRFASALTVPFAPLRALGRVSERQVADFFGCSLTAASVALRRPNIVTPYDEAVLALYAERIRAFKSGGNPLDISYDL
ncbi:MAG: ImmA/IrrE family metallo-endopeptidase [Clostridia bacterium]|nr:ImmA/IrrE family metallo-endopeptidase [Clostridia bacterium]